MPSVYNGHEGYGLDVARWEAALAPCVLEGGFFACALLSVGGSQIEITGPRREERSSLRVGAGGRGGIDLAFTPELSFLAYVDMEAALSPVSVHFEKGRGWKEAVGQVAVSFAVAGTFPGAR